jgi:glycosyltransferase involved in cell wall biosynthesis
MRITFLVERPTQFEAPFFRHAARDSVHQLRVLFSAPDLGVATFDPELGREIDWGIDLLGGYSHASCPVRGRARWLAGELRRERCDLVITNGYTRREYLVAAALARRAGIRTALRLDSVAFGGTPGGLAARRLLYRLALGRLYDFFLGVGSLTVEYLEQCGVTPPRIGLFPYAVDVEHFRHGSMLSAEARTAGRLRLGVPAGSKLVLAVAKLNAREAPLDLLHALPSLDADLRLVIAGDGPWRGELERLAAGMGGSAADRVRFLGYVAYPELPALYAAADLFVHAAREERWGVSVAEALACGLPVLASSRVGAGRDLIDPGRNGFVYASGDAAELASRAAEALALPRSDVEAASREILARWDYAAAWASLLEIAGRPGVGGERARGGGE